MTPFTYARAADPAAALGLATGSAQYLAGGTQLLDLMKIGVIEPPALVDINDLEPAFGRVDVDAGGLRLGALARMSTVADHAAVGRDYPVVRDALQLAASAQLRNMASLAGNVLQRTRCNYFRDVSWACNKRRPGSGCSAREGVNRRLAVLGVSDDCIANYPGDFAIALVALDAAVETLVPGGQGRRFPFESLHRAPGSTPHLEHTLAPGELITGFHVPAGAWMRRSRYVKVRDRDSYDFALASAAVALDLRDGVVAEARIGLGGLVARPWRAREAEASLRGAPFNEAAAVRAATVAFADAVAHGDAAFKPELGRRTLVRALLEVAAMEIRDDT